MKVTTGQWMSGMPANDTYYIQFDSGVRLAMSVTQYKELCNSIDEKNAADIDRINELTERYNKKVNTVSELIKDVRNLFFEDYEDIFLRKSIENIDQSKVEELLEKNNRLLGFE